jgi:predicted class III extradiol MEMO1 family dioxygenase
VKVWHWALIGISAGILAGVLLFVVSRESRVESADMKLWRNSAFQQSNNLAIKQSSQGIEMASSASTDLLDSAFANKTSYAVPSGARILLVPHHLVAARQIASLLSSVPKPSRVILITPDHLGVGKGIVTIGNSPIEINGTVIPADAESARRIAASVSGAVEDTSSVTHELAMQALLPFAAKAWPGAEVVPVLVRGGVTSHESRPSRAEPRGVTSGSEETVQRSNNQTIQQSREATASAIAAILREDPDALLLASVDFSHYLPAEVADFHDELAKDVISSLADLEVDRVELDNPSVLAIALKTARELGLGNAFVHTHTNSLRILQSKLSSESTSHLLASFSPGWFRAQDTPSILFLGDVMLDRTVRTRMSKAKTEGYPFDLIKGEERRFFEGQDFVVANLEGPVTPTRRPPVKEIDFAFDPSVVPLLKNIGIDAVCQANNHDLDQGRAGAEESKALLEKGGIAAFGDQVKDDAASAMAILESRGKKIALLGFNDSDRPVNREIASQTIKEAKSKADFVVVTVHWGNEYQAEPNARQSSLAHWFVDEGVDAVIGGHPHWMQSVEVYKNRVIAYSLGNFVFDQDWSAETREGLAAGLVLAPDSTQLYLYPVHIEKSQPSLLTGDARRSRLDRLASVSDPGLSESIKAGMIRVSR